MTFSDRAIELSGNLGIRDAAATLDRLQAALAAASSLTIDCSALTGADLSFVQMLAAARATAMADGKALRLVAPVGTPLHTLLQQSGFLGPDGSPKAPHDRFWAGATDSEAA